MIIIIIIIIWHTYVINLYLFQIFLKKPKMSRVTPGAWIIQRHTSEIIEGEIFQFKMNLKICFNL